MCVIVFELPQNTTRPRESLMDGTGNGTLVDPPDSKTDVVACLARLEQAFRDSHRVNDALLHKHDLDLYGDGKRVGIIEKVRNLQATGKKIKWIAVTIIGAAIPLIVTALLKLLLKVDVE